MARSQEQAALKKLAARRREWIQNNRENGFEEGIRQLLTELYPDKAHFIYELLQNAEDVGAKTVRFKLTKDRLVFEHDGERLFSLEDVESITNIDSSTNSDDETEIGEFGVGFKAVFSYTNSPEIHSGKFHFRLHDFVVPTTEGVEQKSLGHGVTRFIFPFDNPSKLPDDAISEIKEGLQKLEDNTLLFLNNISRIEYILFWKKFSIERIDHGDGHIEICSKHANEYEDEDEDIDSSHWLRFQKEVFVENEDGEEINCRIAIAYSLQQQEKKKQQTGWVIAPVERGKVFIYFPAEQETSNLLFHLHAPFASTVARDIVRDCDANNELRDELAELVVESLFFIRDKGMLNMAFLAVFPNPTGNLPKFYEPIRDAIASGTKLQLEVVEISTDYNHDVEEILFKYEWVNWTKTAIDQDYSIEYIQQYIHIHSQTASLLLWNCLIRADKKVAFAKFRPNQQWVIRTVPSQLIYHLQRNDWIPDKSGKFRKPEDMTREELPDEFIYDDSNGLITAINFGKRARERDEDYQRRNSNAKEFGFVSVEEAEQLSEFKRMLEEGGQSLDSFLKEVKSKKKSAAFPERPVSDPTRREVRVAEQFADAPDKTSETRQRTVRTSRSAIDPTTWLQRNYTNADDQMICQICQQEMPFKKRDGAPYFESREIFAGKKGKKYLSKEHEAQYLALCPVCAAKYKEFVQNDEQAMATLKAAFLATDGLEIPVTLGEEKHHPLC